MGYYLIALRNNKFHQYNRFYLLISVVASWVIPLLKIEIPGNQKVQQPIYQAFTYISESNSAFEQEPIQLNQLTFNWLQLLPVIYCLVAAIILFGLVHSLFRIYLIYRKYPRQKLENIVLLNTSENGTPFSFFKLIFWNDEIDVNSKSGKQILQHELTHVQEKHSWDKLFIQISLVFGWFNPCFWLIKKELEITHEFIADNKAIANSNVSDFASMLLLA
ncbi:MAG TPA: M56 family metallopeptidase, partial [Saprospiraceae bacterium]|nr:M56 family metallopeptidase [Saprospiraceae bacterium]